MPRPEKQEPGKPFVLATNKEFDRWFCNFSRSTGMPRSRLVEAGLDLLARDRGFAPPPFRAKPYTVTVI